MTIFSAVEVRRGRAHPFWAGILLASVGAGAMLLPVSAANAQAVRSFNIAAGSLADALNDFAEQSGVQLIYAAALVEGRSSTGLKGGFGNAEALSRLLAGSGITFRQTGTNAFTLDLAPATADGAVQLGPVRVEGQADDRSSRGLLADGPALTEGTRSYTTNGPVTAATGMGLTLRETPQSVTVVTRQRIDDQALNSLGQVLEQAPGIVFSPSGPSLGGYGPVFSRGYRVNSYQINGVATPSNAWSRDGYAGSVSLDTAVYDTVVVVRGATGLLTGVGDPGASINFVRKRPTETIQGSLALSLGSWNQLRAVGDISGPLNAAATVRARVVGIYEEGDSWIDRYDGRKGAVYGVLDADLTDRTLLSVAIEHSRESGDTGPTTGMDAAFTDGTPTPFSRRSNALTDWSHYSGKRTMISGSLTQRLDDDWRAKLAYSRSTRDGRPKFGSTGVTEPDGLATVMLRNDIEENQVDVLDARLDGQFELGGRRHDLVMGLNMSDSDIDNPRSITIRRACCAQVLGWTGNFAEPDWAALAPTSSIPRRTQTITQTGVYLATRLRVSDALAVIGGLRWSNWKTRMRNLDTGDVMDDRKENGVFTPSVGAVFDFTSHLSAYASYTTVFNPQSAEDVNGRILDPEQGSNSELGLKGAWLDGRLNASAAVFWIRKDNLAVLDDGNLTPGGDDAFRAEDNTEGRGWELEISGELAPGLQVQGGYTHVVTKDSAGFKLNLDQPRRIFKLYGTWTPQSLDDRLAVGGGVRWQSKIFAAGEDEPFRSIYTQKAYAVVDLNARYAFTDRLTLSVNLNNLFDKTYRTDIFTHIYGAPRNVLATLRARF